jgi:hypothetical protein
MKCCAQLRVKLLRSEAAKERQTRKRSLMEYIPKGVCAAVHSAHRCSFRVQ